MTWEQKLEALQGLTETCLRMRKPGDWYVSAVGRSVVTGNGGGFLTGAYGNGATPEAAVLDDWQKIATSGVPIKVESADYKSHRYVRWTHYMWKEITMEEARILAKP